jgi:probable rRNA maturation factor
MSIDVLNESNRTVNEELIVALARHVLGELGVNPLAELSVLLVDVESMAQLHERYMDEPGPTDVLAFPMDELHTSRHDEDPGPQPTLLGDVVLCPEVAERQAREAGHGTEDELHLLCTHGVLHLLGYDHGDPDEERAMFDVQGRVLESWRRTRAAGAPG